MRKLLVGLSIILACFTAWANPIRSSGVGSSFEEAKQAAFRAAIEQEIGTALVSNTEILDGVATKNEILAYSSGYVKNYNVVNSAVIGGRVHLVLDVWVLSSKISGRILSTAQGPRHYNGSSASATIETWMDNRDRSDRIIGAVLADWPRRAINVNINNIALGFDAYRNPTLTINYRLEYNPDWIVAFKEVLSLTSDMSSKSNPESMVLFEDNPRAVLVGNRWTYWGFHDYTTLGKLRLFFELNEPKIKINFRGSGLGACLDLPKLLFYNSETHYNGISAIKMHPRAVWSGSNTMYLSKDATVISGAHTVEARAVRKSECD